MIEINKINNRSINNLSMLQKCNIGRQNVIFT